MTRVILPSTTKDHEYKQINEYEIIGLNFCSSIYYGIQKYKIQCMMFSPIFLACKYFLVLHILRSYFFSITFFLNAFFLHEHSLRGLGHGRRAFNLSLLKHKSLHLSSSKHSFLACASPPIYCHFSQMYLYAF